MSDDYGKATGAARTIEIGDTRYRVAKFGPRSLGDLQAWLKEQVPDPRLKAREICQGLSDAVALQVWRDCCEEAADWPPSVDTTEGNRLLTMTHEGAAMLLWVMLRKYNPNVDLAEARRIAADDDAFDSAKINELVNMGWPEESWTPKSPGETALQ